MTQQTSFIARILGRFLPTTPDFFALLEEQADTLTTALDVFVLFMETGDREQGLRVREIEHEADTVKARNLRALNQAFSTPMDREDIDQAIWSIDEVVNYCETTVREMEALEIGPDRYSLDMAFRLREGAKALAQGFSRLSSRPLDAEKDAEEARKAERRVEEIYRRALSELFRCDDYVNMFKRRELYRHLSNAADRLADAAHVLLDIAVKIS